MTLEERAKAIEREAANPDLGVAAESLYHLREAVAEALAASVQEIVDQAYKAMVLKRIRDAVKAISPEKAAEEVQPTAIVESEEPPDTVQMSRVDDPANFYLLDDVATKLKEIFPKPSAGYS